jgi:CRISPR-associated protein Csm5
MRYRVTCLTPVLAGDGRRLSPIDYMVWRDQVNVLDQHKIFRLLARGPRLEGYLSQLRKAETLDFASWGGFAQNYADRRVPFEHASSTRVWERAPADSLSIPTFSAGLRGPYLPGSVLKGALRTGLMFSRWARGVPEPVLAQFEGERIPRRPAEAGEDRELGRNGADQMRLLRVDDSQPVDYSGMRVYLLRVATVQARGGGKQEPGWKVSPRGAVDARQADSSTPYFAEMAMPGTTFEGRWSPNSALLRTEVRRELRWRESFGIAEIVSAANAYAAQQLQLHRSWADSLGLAWLSRTLDDLQRQNEEAAATKTRCLLAIGWGAGMLSKSALLDPQGDTYRRIFRNHPLYSRAIATGLPFPKTRRIVFEQGQPSNLPGWVQLDLEP